MPAAVENRRSSKTYGAILPIGRDPQLATGLTVFQLFHCGVNGGE
jgi:hypothetical protein